MNYSPLSFEILQNSAWRLQYQCAHIAKLRHSKWWGELGIIKIIRREGKFPLPRAAIDVSFIFRRSKNEALPK